MTRFQYLLVKHTGRATAQSGNIILIGVVALVLLPQLPRFEAPSTEAATLAFMAALAIVVLGRVLEAWGELRSSADREGDPAKHYNPYRAND